MNDIISRLRRGGILDAASGGAWLDAGFSRKAA